MTKNILSLFDGISVLAEAIKRTPNLKIDQYYSSEIDPYAIKVSSLNHPDIQQLGCIKKLDEDKLKELGEIFLQTVSFPCQDTSVMGKRAGLKGERSGLVFEALRVHKIVKPKFFIYENVCGMSMSDRAIIDNALGVKCIMIDSAKVSAQTRKRLYWTNIPGIEQPEDLGIELQDILTDGYADRKKAYTVLTGTLSSTQKSLERYLRKCTGQICFKEKYFAELDKETKIERFRNMQKLDLTPKGDELYKNGVFKKLSVNEIEALQTLPKDYSSGVSNSRRYFLLGNSYTCSVISHLLSFIPTDE